MDDEYRKQKPVPEELAEYGIKHYTDIQLKLHTDVMKLMKSVKYKDIPADDCLIVFGRVYSLYVMSQLKKEGKLKIVKKK